MIRDEDITVLQLRSEINGCDVLCLGCHRIRHLKPIQHEDIRQTQYHE